MHTYIRIIFVKNLPENVFLKFRFTIAFEKFNLSKYDMTLLIFIDFLWCFQRKFFKYHTTENFLLKSRHSKEYGMIITPYGINILMGFYFYLLWGNLKHE